MPSRWESSNRPLFVRTVWVNGLRHAILSTDDPLLQYKYRSTPSSITSSETSSVISGSYQLEECLIKLRLALNPTEKEESVISYQQYDDTSFMSDKLPTLQTKIYYTDTPEVLPSLPDEENQLSERVLQWLDLSGQRLSVQPEPADVKRLDRRKPEIRRTYTARRKDFPTRSLSVDLPNLKTTRKVKKERKTSLEDVPPVMRRPSSPIPPIVQSFDTPRQRLSSGWPTSPNRPQLHIFMPPLDSEVEITVHNRQEEGSECESCTSDLA